MIGRSVRTSILALFLLPSLAAAQKLTPGAWTGTVAVGGQPDVAVTINVPTSGATDSLTLSAVGQGDFQMQDVRVSGDTLSFNFMPGPMVKCGLTRAPEGSYSGTCSSDVGDLATIVLRPPARE
jgi:hypothetical protein